MSADVSGGQKGRDRAQSDGDCRQPVAPVALARGARLAAAAIEVAGEERWTGGGRYRYPLCIIFSRF